MEKEAIRKASGREIEKVIESAKRDLADLIAGRNLGYREKTGNIAALVPGYSFAYLIALKPELAPAIREIGKTVGSIIVASLVKSTDLGGCINEIAKIIELAKLGITQVTKFSNDRFMLRVGECADCGGIPDLGRPLCAFDEGLIEGTIESKVKIKVSVREDECVEEGLKYCDFEIRVV